MLLHESIAALRAEALHLLVISERINTVRQSDNTKGVEGRIDEALEVADSLALYVNKRIVEMRNQRHAASNEIFDTLEFGEADIL